MNRNEDITSEEWEQVEGYLHETLAPEERRSFEEKLSTDAALQNKLEAVRLLLQGVSEAALQQQLKEFHRELPATAPVRALPHRKLWLSNLLVAASVILVLLAAGWFFWLKEEEHEALFATYFTPDPGLLTSMGATDNYAFEKAMVEYKTGEYRAAIQTWDSLQRGQPANDTLNYFLGVAYLAANDPATARTYLQKVTAAPQGFFREDAFWYLGLALLKEGKRAEAKAALQQGSHPQKETLLKELND